MMARAWPLSAPEYSLMLPPYSLRNQKQHRQTKTNRGRGAVRCGALGFQPDKKLRRIDGQIGRA